ncbi:MAG: 1,4-beta-xylanase [Bacteroidia bacterium]|nr:1,4-beta-xylanase [Bacteroidia bacterium]
MVRLWLRLIVLIVACVGGLSTQAQTMSARSYCNPLNVDYTYMIYNADKHISYRSGADPAVVEFRGEYYMFVTRSLGYWHSKDLLNWDFITPQSWYFQGSNAPAAHNYKDSVLYVTGDPSGAMSVLYTDNPKKGDWKAVPTILTDLQDPALFIDDDEQAYLFWGSSNLYPIRGRKLDRVNRFLPVGGVDTLFNKNMALHGWERFGENNADTVIPGYIEGPWMTKHNGTYYLQYGAPGTEFNVYGDGVYMARSPLGPYTYAPNNPISFKPGGFMNGAGHGSTVKGPGGHYWHFSSMALSSNVNWERRLCMFPLYFDRDGLMYADSEFGDYPHYAPAESGVKGGFTGWMLLSYRKPVTASSFRDGHTPDLLTDEQVKSFWLAETNGAREWVQIDLLRPSTVHAMQINYFDYQSNLYGRVPGLRHRYVVEGSLDGKQWLTLIDKRNSFKDCPNDYVELETPQKVRYVRYSNIEVPTPNLALSDIRVFGRGDGQSPAPVKAFTVVRDKDRRNASLTWKAQPGVQGYVVKWGIAPDKLYHSWMVYDENKLSLRCLNTAQKYFFSIQSFNENGVSKRITPVQVN